MVVMQGLVLNILIRLEHLVVGPTSISRLSQVLMMMICMQAQGL